MLAIPKAMLEVQRLGIRNFNPETLQEFDTSTTLTALKSLEQGPGGCPTAVEKNMHEALKCDCLQSASTVMIHNVDP